MRSFDNYNQTVYQMIQYKDFFSDFKAYEIDVKYSKELNYIQEIQNYEDNWDSYDGKMPKKNSILFSIDFLSNFADTVKNLDVPYNDHFPEFCLAGDGILGLEWDYAKNANLFARVYSPNKIDCILTENDQKRHLKEMKGADFIEMCKRKLQLYSQAA